MLSRRFKIGTFFDIGLYVHWSFFLLPLFLIIEQSRSGSNPVEITVAVALLLVVFTCVILHEYGHALAARAFGIRTRDITMLPIGGVARLERMPKDPIQEIIVAIAGPAVNVVIAITLALGLLLISGSPMSWDMNHNTFAFMLLVTNVVLIVFNMIPAFPMDGGRVFRAMASLFTSYRRATWLAMRLGQLFAVAFGILGFYYAGSPFFPVIAAFIFWVGAMEYRHVKLASRVSGMKVSDIMNRDFETVDSQSSIRSVLATVVSKKKSLPVENQGRYCGMLYTSALMKQKYGDSTALVSSVMETPEPLKEDEKVEELLQSLASRRNILAVVNSSGMTVGVLDFQLWMSEIAQSPTAASKQEDQELPTSETPEQVPDSQPDTEQNAQGSSSVGRITSGS